MSFDNKDYPNRKDNRRHYKFDYAKSVDKSCRNHGDCNHCKGNRLIKTNKNELIAKNELANFEKEDVKGDKMPHTIEGIGYA